MSLHFENFDIFELSLPLMLTLVD